LGPQNFARFLGESDYLSNAPLKRALKLDILLGGYDDATEVSSVDYQYYYIIRLIILSNLDPFLSNNQNYHCRPTNVQFHIYLR